MEKEFAVHSTRIWLARTHPQDGHWTTELIGQLQRIFAGKRGDGSLFVWIVNFGICVVGIFEVDHTSHESTGHRMF